MKSSYFGSSIGKKDIVAFSGLALCGFLIAHLAGNLLLLAGPQTFNEYSHKLVSNPLIYVAEAGLAVVFLVHIFLALNLNLHNRRARGTRYVKKAWTGRGTDIASATMVWTGLITLVFLVLHLMNLKFGSEYEVNYGGVPIRDMYRTVIEYFASIGNVVWYIVAHAALALHTSHGVHSSFQSIGFHHPRITPLLEKLAAVYAVVISGGFAFLAVWAHLQGGQ